MRHVIDNYARVVQMERRIYMYMGEIRKGEAGMEILSSNSMLMMQKSMDFLWSKQSCILDNIANVETPNYKVKYATFEEALKQAIDGAAAGGEVRSPRTMRQALSDTQITIHEASDESTRLDDNGVNITEQSVELSRNAYQLQYVMDAINSDINLLRVAIRG